MTSKHHRLCIVEDDERTRQILSEIIESQPQLELVAEYGLPLEAISKLPADQPDVVLMDINLPDINGVEAVRRLKPQMLDTQFLILTVYEDPNHIFEALSAGATGYLLKGASQGELIAAIDQILSGGSPMSSGIARKVVQSFSARATVSSELDTLSGREQSVLTLLTKGYLYKEIADALSISVPTVNTYIRRIYEKLQVRTRSEAVAKYLNAKPTASRA